MGTDKPAECCQAGRVIRATVLFGRVTGKGAEPQSAKMPPGLGSSETGSCLSLLPPTPTLSCWEMASQRIPEKRAGGAVVYLRFCSWEKPRSLCQKRDSLSIMCPGGMQIKLARGSNSRLGAFLWRPCSIWLPADSGICSQRRFCAHLRGAICISCIVAGFYLP